MMNFRPYLVGQKYKASIMATTEIKYFLVLKRKGRGTVLRARVDWPNVWLNYFFQRQNMKNCDLCEQLVLRFPENRYGS